MIFKLPARWRREAEELERLAVLRDNQCEEEVAQRLQARADTHRMLAAELADELAQTPVHTAPDEKEGTAHAHCDRPDPDPDHRPAEPHD